MAMPEEVNRILTDRVSQWLFTPTALAADHLRREGMADKLIKEVGDVMYDVALFHGKRVDAAGRILEHINLLPKSYVLATIHRAENTDCPNRLLAIVDALIKIASQLPVVWPLHPRTRAVLQKLGKLDVLSDKLNLIDPVGYLDMVQLEKFAALIATDSGGVQKEAFFYKVPCVTLRDETEWTELIDAGWNRLAPPLSSDAIILAVEQSLGVVGQAVQPYGQGDTAKRIVQELGQ
jgi:UDP-GlcNAc3NAcA epimerase